MLLRTVLIRHVIPLRPVACIPLFASDPGAVQFPWERPAKPWATGAIDPLNPGAGCGNIPASEEDLFGPSPGLTASTQGGLDETHRCFAHVLAALPAAASLPPPPRGAIEACLTSTLDTYMQAVLKHDPSAAPLAGSYRHAENAISKPLGKGIWESASALGKVQRRYVDTVSGQAAYYGIL